MYMYREGGELGQQSFCVARSWFSFFVSFFLHIRFHECKWRKGRKRMGRRREETGFFFSFSRGMNANFTPHFEALWSAQTLIFNERWFFELGLMWTNYGVLGVAAGWDDCKKSFGKCFLEQVGEKKQRKVKIFLPSSRDRPSDLTKPKHVITH